MGLKQFCYFISQVALDCSISSTFKICMVENQVLVIVLGPEWA